MARPQKDIDALQIYKLASTGTKVTEIAALFDVSTDTINRRFAAELAKGRAQLRADLRKAQIEAAKQGNSTMLVWLGKQYLDQSDSIIDQYVLEALQQAGLNKDDLIELIKNKSKINAEMPRVSFAEFCAKANYPAPFPKQIEMMDFVMSNGPARMLLGSRGYGKTDYGPILGVAYKIYLDPDFTCLIITKSKERNAAMLREIEQACRANGITFEKANASHLRKSGLRGKDHSVSAVTIKTVTLRGRHPDLVIMDDPVTEDDVSEATRLHIERVYNEVNKLVGNIAIIGQPAHKYDLYAKLRDKVKTLEVPWGSIPELDADLDAQRLAGVDEKSIQASYFLKVISEGTVLFDNIKYLKKFPTGGTAVAFIDPASEGKDYTAISIVKAHMQGIAVEGFVWRKAWNHCLDDIAPLLKKNNVAKLAFETNSLGDQPLDILRQVFKNVGVIGRKSHTNKHARISAAAAYAHMIHLSEESSKLYRDHVVQYEYGSKFDDAPDSLATCLEWIGLIRGKR